MAKKKKPITYFAADLFCGAGGTSTGMLEAMQELGLSTHLLAINHWEIAIATHELNHPQVAHRCESVDGADPRKLVPGGVLHLLWASPECTGHSNARGGKPTNEQSRATAWHVLRWAEAIDVKNILIENVREFRDWGPLHTECTCNVPAKVAQLPSFDEWKSQTGGKQNDYDKLVAIAQTHSKTCKLGKPIADKKGVYYRNFLRNLRVLGYQVSERLLNAADYGDATTRIRLFIQARKGKRPVWPDPSHVSSDDLGLYPAALPWRKAREVIDWSLVGKSIYNRPRPLADNTMTRIMTGLRKHSGLPFIVPQFSEQGPRTVDLPLGTITTTSRGVGLAEPYVVNMKGQSTARNIDQPLPTQTGMAHLYVAEPFILPHQHGSSGLENVRSADIPFPTITGQSSDMFLVEPFIVPQFGEREGQEPRTHSLEAPLPAVTSHGAGAIVQPFIIGAGGPTGAGRPQSVEQPLGTVLAQDHRAVIEPFIVKYYEGSDAASVDKPMPTVTANYEHLGLAQPYLVVLRNNCDGKSVDGPVPTIVAGGEHIGVCEPFVVVNRTHSDSTSVDEPIRTLTTGGNMGVAEPYIIPVTHSGGEERCHSIDEPLPTVTTAHRGEFAVVEPYLVKYHGSHAGLRDGDNRVHSVENPVPTVDASPRLAVAQPFLVKYCNGGASCSLDDPLDTQTTRDRFALVSPEFIHLFDKGDVVGWLDIRFRMLQPHELAAAMGFPKGYKFAGNREDQIRQIGNAVCVNLAKALVKAVLGTEVAK